MNQPFDPTCNMQKISIGLPSKSRLDDYVKQLESIIQETDGLTREIENCLDPVLFIEASDPRVPEKVQRTSVGFPAGDAVTNLADNITAIRDRLQSVLTRLAV